MSFHDMGEKAGSQWRNPDVHYWSGQLRETLSNDTTNLVAKINALEPKYPLARAKVMDLYKNEDVVTKQNIETFLKRCDALCSVRDAAASGASCGGCLAMMYCLVAHNKFEPSLVEAMKMTIYDIGTTCLQGYTHRMLSFIIALTRDMESSNENCDDWV